jgi:hypothetical protein
MTRTKRDYVWVPVFAVLVAFGIPWFLWGSAATWAGLPVWLWWHVGWMVLATVAFAGFVRGAWDRGMDVDGTAEIDG